MKMYKILFSPVIIIFLFGCKSSIKQQDDTVYSRHLQRHVGLTIITTPMPNKKEEMNLLLFNKRELLESVRAKRIIDSLFKKKLIQPLVLVAFDGKNEDYGLEETEIKAAKQYKQFNDFVTGELYPFVKKKVVIRKFNSVAICGFGETALSAFDVGWNNDEKVSMVGMFDPALGTSGDNSILQTIEGLRKRPNLKLWIAGDKADSLSLSFKKIMDNRKSISECTLILRNAGNDTNFAEFLLWAFPK